MSAAGSTRRSWPSKLDPDGGRARSWTCPQPARTRSEIQPLRSPSAAPARLYNRPFRLNRLGGPSDVCEESSVQEKDPGSEQDERSEEGEAEGRGSLGKVSVTQDAAATIVEKDSEVSPEHEPEKGVEERFLGPKGSAQGSCEAQQRRREEIANAVRPNRAACYAVSETAQLGKLAERAGSRLHAVPAEARRAVHEQGAARAFPAAPARLEARAHGRSRSHDAPHEGRRGELPRSERSRDPGVGVRPRASHARS